MFHFTKCFFLSWIEPCKDKNRSCWKWLNDGYCSGQYASWMKRNCRKSCNKCLQTTKVNCKWSSWGRWEPCSKTCGQGTQVRTRTIVKKAKNGGRKCAGKNKASKPCNKGQCSGRQ